MFFEIGSAVDMTVVVGGVGQPRRQHEPKGPAVSVATGMGMELGGEAGARSATPWCS